MHSKCAAEAVLDKFEVFPDCKIPILHWFSGSISELQRAISLGCCFGVGPAMLTSERSPRLR